MRRSIPIGLQILSSLAVVVFILHAAVFIGVTEARLAVVISPARLEAVVGGRVHPELTVLNRGEERVLVRLSLAGGGHDLDGMPLIDESREAVAAISARVRLMPEQLLLAAGEAAKVRVVVVDEEGSGGLYPVILADIAPLGEAGGAVSSRTRIAVPTLLTYASRGEKTEPELAVAGVKLEQGRAGEPLLVTALLHNTGKMHVRAGGRAVISGEFLGEETVLFPPVTILPGAMRKVTGQWAPAALPPGRYTVKVLPDGFRGGGMSAAGLEVSFDVLHPYELAQARLELVSLQTPVLVAGQRIPVQAVVANRGNIPARDAVLELLVLNSRGEEEAAYRWLMEALPPGKGQEFAGEIELANRLPGEYLLVASLWQEDEVAAILRREFRLAAEPLLAALSK